MSISFYGLDAEGKPIAQDVEDPKYLNMCAGNAVVLLKALGLESEVEEDPGIYGEVSMEKALAAVQRGQGVFIDRLVSFAMPYNEEYFLRRFADFEACINELKRLGAKKLYWG
jgi:hypothetical protein